jgi:hypothetical protein
VRQVDEGLEDAVRVAVEADRERLRAAMRLAVGQFKATAEDDGTHPEERLRADHWAAAYTSVLTQLDALGEPISSEAESYG